MTLAQDGAEQMIGRFGETVRVYEQSGQKPEDSTDPIFFEENENTSNYTEHKVRLYTTASNEMMEDYGMSEDTEAMMYSTEDIAANGDIVRYPDENYEWGVDERITSQIGNGPYLYVYGMLKI